MHVNVYLLLYHVLLLCYGCVLRGTVLYHVCMLYVMICVVRCHVCVCVLFVVLCEWHRNLHLILYASSLHVNIRLCLYVCVAWQDGIHCSVATLAITNDIGTHSRN